MDNPTITEKDIVTTLEAIADNFNKDLFSRTEAELEDHWHFEWDKNASIEWNIYKFHDLLKLYGSFCRRWEEHHNGSCCVIERVRDKYLMPKIRKFKSDLLENTSGKAV